MLGGDLDEDAMSLLAEIQAHKGTTVKLSMSELQGLSKEEKIKLFKQKQEQFRFLFIFLVFYIFFFVI